MSTLLIVCFLSLSLFSVNSIADDEMQPPEDHNDNVQSVIKLDAETQELSGIETITLKSVKYQAEFIANGKAVNIHPLLALRNRYLIALTENASAKAKFKQAEQNVNRQENLYRHGVSSKRNLQEQQAQWQTYKAQADAADFQGKAVIDEALVLWGKQLTDWALSSDADKLGVFLSRRKRLLHITLPTNKHLADDIRSIYINTSGDHSKASKAELVSVAALTETVAQGESYYFQTDDKHIITGMNITAWIPEQNVQLAGVIIPKFAVMWHMGQAFVYLKTAPNTFVRRIIDQYSATAEGYFIADALHPGQQIVATGGQMLLSEELRGQIPKEDDD